MEFAGLFVMPSFPKRISVSLDVETHTRIMAMIPPGEKQASFTVRRILAEYFSTKPPMTIAEEKGTYVQQAEIQRKLEAHQAADRLAREARAAKQQH